MKNINKHSQKLYFMICNIFAHFHAISNQLNFPINTHFQHYLKIVDFRPFPELWLFSLLFLNNNIQLEYRTFVLV